MKRLIWGVLAAMFSGCATNSGGYMKASDVENQLLSMNSEEIKTDLGKPRFMTKMEDYREIWTYFDQPNGLAGGSCSIRLIVESKKIFVAEVQVEGTSSFLYPLESCRNLLRNLRSPNLADGDK